MMDGVAERRPLVAVIGDANLDAGRYPDDAFKKEVATRVGLALVDAGCRVVTGGIGGVMDYVMRGAQACLLEWY